VSTKKPSLQAYLSLLIPLGISLLYLVTHLWDLLNLPVFADESIYIRWAQLIIDNWQTYLFFPLNDGKTPLFVWLLVPFQFLFANQLWSARFVSVIVGLVQVWVIKMLIQKLGGRQKAQWLGMLFTSYVPYWFFHHRMALMDGLLTLFLSLTVLGLVMVSEKMSDKKWKVKDVWKQIVLIGICFGLSLWTKLPALFLLPVFPFFVFLTPFKNWSALLKKAFYFLVSAGIGLVMLGVLKVSPAFGQLFHRSSDFTYPLSEILFQAKWKDTLANIPAYYGYLVQYGTTSLVILSLAGLFSQRYRKVTVLFWLAALIFVAPFVLLGKVVYARYLMPAMIFVTVSAALNFQAIYDHWFKSISDQQLVKKIFSAVILVSIVGGVFSQSAQFMVHYFLDPGTTPFVESDKQQYLQQWSAGYGTAETVKYIRQQAKDHSIAVATEGRFGTLPDGLLLFFHRTNVDNIYIEGTGQYPIKTIPDFFIERAKKFNQSILVVNSDRMELKLGREKLIAEYCRPNHGTCLQVWDITAVVQQ
jgi:4-amino-4-deoxy-L-arabinose transferase-like glycosyltransferase